MPDPDKPIAPPKVSCHVCGKEIPRSAAQSAEAREYTYYFCGASCRLLWTRRPLESPPASHGPG